MLGAVCDGAGRLSERRVGWALVLVWGGLQCAAWRSWSVF